MEKVVILGAGSWGTALGTVLAKNGYEVILWEYRKEVAEEIDKDRENKKLLPNIKLADNIRIVYESENLLNNTKYVIFSIPSQSLRSVVERFSSQITDNMILVNTAKGIEVKSGKRLSEVIKDEILGKYHKNLVVLSGPTHAEEVAREIPTTIVAAGDIDKAKEIQKIFTNNNFRVYLNNDLVGVEIGAAVKNCLAIAAGMCDGLGYGDNSKAALITRGIVEMTRYGKLYGANETTFSGLSGMGDLIVTAISKHSRNRHVGECLGKGQKIDEILNNMLMVAEGVPTVKAIYNEIKEKDISMPIIEAVYKVIYENTEVTTVINDLMNRSVKKEFY